MSAVFVDTSALIAAEDGADPDLQNALCDWLDHLWRTRSGCTSMQALAEFYDNVTTRPEGAMPQGDARAAIRRYHAWTPWQTDAATLETAWRWRLPSTAAVRCCCPPRWRMARRSVACRSSIPHYRPPVERPRNHDRRTDRNRPEPHPR